MDIARWNHRTHEYDFFQPPEDWKIVLYTTEMDMPINCTNCGRDATYGDCFTSKEIHNHVGLGYPVCNDCYQDELTRAKEAHRYGITRD